MCNKVLLTRSAADLRSIRVELREDGVLVARLETDPHGLFSRGQAGDLAALVRRAHRDPSIRAVVLTGSHPDRFVSHADLSWLQRDGAVVPPLGWRVMSVVVWLASLLNSNPITRWLARRTPIQGAVQLDEMHKTLRLMSRSSTVFVAALNGSALGLGAEISWACDARVMADGPHVIGHLEVLLGFAPGAGGTQRLAMLVGSHRARRLMLDGVGLSPDEALALGAVDEVVAQPEVVTRAVALANVLASRPVSAIAAIKRAVEVGEARGLQAGLRHERAEFLASLPQAEAQAIMLDYLSETARDGELPVYRTGGLEAARARGRATGGPTSLGSNSIESVGKHGVTRQTVHFTSGPSWCAAWLYLPAGASADSPVPGVVMGHGLGATRELGLDRYAERFAARGLAALVFTYRGLGDSGGHPRQVLSMRQQLKDWDAAIDYARTRPEIDSTRVAIWGSSLGGGHALVTAARHPDLIAMVAQCPFTDGLASALALGPRRALALIAPVVADLVAALRRKPPVSIPVAGQMNVVALMSTPDSFDGMQALVPAGHHWRNEAAARSVLSILPYRPGRVARRLVVPSLICVSASDTVAPAGPTRRHLSGIPAADVRTYDYGHFEFYVGPAFERLVSEQGDFLVEHLQPTSARIRSSPNISGDEFPGIAQ